jgi:flagellar operon protein
MNPFLYPNVSSPISKSALSPERQEGAPKKPGEISEFDRVLESKLETRKAGEFSGAQAPLKFSAHATQRMNDRKIQLDQETMRKVREAVDRAEVKGVEDTLVLTRDAALIVNVPNRTVVTAMDRQMMQENIFTNIDGAVIVS